MISYNHKFLKEDREFLNSHEILLMKPSVYANKNITGHNNNSDINIYNPEN